MTVNPPEPDPRSLADLGRARKEAERMLADLTRDLKAAVAAQAEQGMSEVALAEHAQVDRQTIREWLGKSRYRPPRKGAKNPQGEPTG